MYEFMSRHQPFQDHEDIFVLSRAQVFEEEGARAFDGGQVVVVIDSCEVVEDVGSIEVRLVVVGVVEASEVGIEAVVLEYGSLHSNRYIIKNSDGGAFTNPMMK